MGKEQRRSLEESGRPLDEDAHLWPEGEPDFENLLQRIARELAGGDDVELQMLRKVADRLLHDSVPQYGALHMPAVREALGCLIDEDLHWRGDNKQPKGRKRVSDGVERYGVYVSADKWRVDVCEEAGVALPGRPLRVDVVEFFLKVVRRICEQLALPVAIGTHKLGERLGAEESLQQLCRTGLQGWASWTSEHRRKALEAKEFLLLALWDSARKGTHDWMLVRVEPRQEESCIGAAVKGGAGLRVSVHDRFKRLTPLATLGAKAVALFGGADAARALGDGLELGAVPPGQGSVDAIVVALGVLLSRVARHAGVAAMDSEAPSFVADVRGALACTFAALRREADESGVREVFAYLSSRRACERVLGLLVTRPSVSSVPNAAGSLAVSYEGQAERGPEGMTDLRLLTWNVSEARGVRTRSVQAPDTWTEAENREAVQREVLRWDADVVALQECPSARALPMLVADRYRLVGSSRETHAGFVHLYVRQGWDAPVEPLPSEVPGVAGVIVVNDVRVVVVAVHLEPTHLGAALRGKQLRGVLLGRDQETVVVMGDMNMSEKDATERARHGRGGV